MKFAYNYSALLQHDKNTYIVEKVVITSIQNVVETVYN